ncbi:MAG TPA: LamG domain-containing protein [Actinoplanes sp.]|nr:LamG domain-containing protein [Actinoplanes sp.]
MTTIQGDVATIGSATDELAALRDWLSAHTSDGTLPLTDDVLGFPLLQPLFHDPALPIGNPRIDLTRPDAIGIAGTVELLGASGVTVEISVGGSNASGLTAGLTLAADDADPVRLSGILAGVAGAGTTLPPEVPDLGFTGLGFTVAPRSGAFTADAICLLPFTLPFGGDGLPVGSAGLHLERAADAGAVGVRLDLASAGAVTVTDGFRVTSFALAFHHDDGWGLTGALSTELLGEAVELTASLAETASRREFRFAATAVAAAPVDLAGAGALGLGSLSVTVARGLGTAPAAAPEPGAVRLDPRTAYSWGVSAAGHLDLLDQAIVLDGALTVTGEPGSLRLVFRPGAGGEGAEVAVPLPGAESVVTHLGLDGLGISRATVGGTSTWTVSAEAAVWFDGLPCGLGSVLPGSRDTELTGTFELTTGAEAGVVFSVGPVLPMQPFHLPDLRIPEVFTLDLSQARSAIEVGRLEIRWARGGGLDVSADLGIGIPAELNQIFGAGHDVLVGYDEADPDTLQRLALTASATGGGSGGPALALHPLTSPFAGLTVEPADPGSDERQATVVVPEVGTFSLVVPSIGVSGDTFSARAAVRRQGPLTLPLSPVKWVLKALNLERVTPFLPDRLPLDDVRLYDAVTGLDADGLAGMIRTALGNVPGLPLPDETALREALQTIAAAAERLPDRLKPYLDCHVPEALSVDLKVSAAGALLGGVSVTGPGDAPGTRANATPLRFLLPGLSATGPLLTGIELWNLQVGEILGGAALLVRADLNVDQFDLLPLATLLALPESAPGPADPRSLTRRLVADQLTLLVVPEALVAAPVFCTDLGVEYRGVEGADVGAHLSFPAPALDVAAALALYRQFADFLTSPTALLDESQIAAPGLDLKLTAGPAYLRLPDYLGGQTYGSRTATSSVSAGSNLAHLLNGLKTLRLDELLQALPEDLLHGAATGRPVVLGPLSFSAGYDVATPPGPRPGEVARRGIEVALHGSAELPGLAGIASRLAVRSTTGTDLGMAFAADATLAGGAVALELGGSVISPAPGTPPGGGVLQFTDPAARLSTPGPAWTPNSFSVEWWMYPTGLADYNQFISGDDVWGAFVFHSTASGAVYCGTDVATRFTPADLPAGTVQLNTWQHFAFTYHDGVAILFRNGIQLALKTGMSKPAPWRGMRLGIPVPGSQVRGRIAELRVWDYLRPIQEVQASLRQRLTGSEPGLAGYWPLDEGTGTVVRDLGPSGFDGVTTATSWLPPGADAPPLDAPATAGQPARISGTSTGWLLRGQPDQQQFLSGSVDVEPSRVSVSGKLDLFGDNAVGLKVKGNVAGEITAGPSGGSPSVRLAGNGEVDLAGLTLAAAGVAVTPDALTVDGSWLGRFGVHLELDTTMSHPRLRGRATGALMVDPPFGPVTVLSTGRPVPSLVKLADGFRQVLAVSLALDVIADEASGVSLSGTASFTVGTRTFAVSVRLPQIPATLDALAEQVGLAVRTVGDGVFQSLYSTAEAWLEGLGRKAFAWADGQLDQVGQNLAFFFGKAPGEVAGLLKTSGYGIDQITESLGGVFGSDHTGLVVTLTSAGYSLKQAAGSLASVFAPGAPPYDRAKLALQALAHHYSALDQINVLNSFLPDVDDLGTAIKLLSDVSQFDLRTILTAAANSAYRVTYDTAVIAAGKIGLHL